MHYHVLARKWRPKKFSDIIGQEHIVKAITNSFLLDKVHHAYILCGPYGTGKTTIARLFAKGLNCKEWINSDVCTKCQRCRDIELGCFIDLIEIDAASRTKVEDTREILDNVQYMPSKGRFKVYLIDEVHMLSRNSFNALLKTLEEPPLHAKFILVTTEQKKLPETVLSRCLQFYLKPLNIFQITTQLINISKQENIEADYSALEILARSSKGSMRDALNLLEQAIILGNNTVTLDVVENMFGLVNSNHPLSFIEDIVDGNVNSIMHKINNYFILGINWDYFLSEVIIFLQKIAMHQFLSNSYSINNTKNGITSEEYSEEKYLYALSNSISPEHIQLYYQIFLLGRRELSYAPNHRVAVEMVVLRALAFKSNNTDFMMNLNNSSSISSSSYSTESKSKLNDSYDVSVNSSINSKLRNTHKNNEVLNINKSVNINEKFNVNSKENISLNFNDVSRLGVLRSKIDSSNLDIKKNIASKLLKIRSKLTECCIDNKKNQINNHLSKSNKIIENVLEQFVNLNTKNLSNNIICNKKVNENITKCFESDIENNISVFRKIFESNSCFIQTILDQTIQNDPWINQIFQLSLTESAKKIIMNSWKENIASDKICLHVRSKYQFLISVKLHNEIESIISENTGKLMKICIKQDDDISMKTPMEYIFSLYQKKVLKVKKECINDLYIKTIVDLFDAEIHEKGIVIL